MPKEEGIPEDLGGTGYNRLGRDKKDFNMSLKHRLEENNIHKESYNTVERNSTAHSR